MWQASVVMVWLLALVVLQVCQPCEAFDATLSKSPSPDKNGLPPPLNLDINYTGLMPSSTAETDNFNSFSARHLIPSTTSPGNKDDSDLHLYLQDKISSTLAPNSSIDSLETKCFSRSYEKETTEQRIGRLEQFIFGKAAVVGNTQARLEKITKVVNPQSFVSSPAEGLSEAYPKPASKSLISVINDGIDYYNLHDYQRAEENFEKCCAMAPDMARVHSYLAISKLQLNQREAALEEFRTTYEIDPFGTYGRYAKVCLLKLAGDEEIRKRGPVDSDEILQSSLAKINNQSENLIAFHNHESSRTPHANTGSFFESQIQATNNRNNTVLQNAYTQESANNLKHLMGLRSKPGDPHLRAWGTTLNTRYYGADTYLYAPYYIPREYPVELKAQQNSLAAQSNKTKSSIGAKNAKNGAQNSKKRQHHV